MADDLISQGENAYFEKTITTGVNMERTDKMLRPLGFQFTGGNYVVGV